MWNSNDFTVERYNVLKLKHGFTPKRILDIGANVGQWYKIIQDVYLDAEVLSIEANPNCEHQLKQINPNYMITFLGQQEGTTDFYTPKDNPICTGGSTYLEQTKFYNETEVQQLPVITLDSLNQQFDFIKMDVQGAELDIIKGGLKTVLDASVLQLELGVLNYNQGAPRASEIISYLYSLDFHLFDIGSFFYWDGMLNQSDIFFVNTRKYSSFGDVFEYYRNL
jgi:FkbM family methyltransferase